MQKNQEFYIYVVSGENHTIIPFLISYPNSTFETIIQSLKNSGEPTNIFYYDGSLSLVNLNSKISSYLPERENQVVFWATNNVVNFPIIRPEGDDLLVIVVNFPSPIIMLANKKTPVSMILDEVKKTYPNSKLVKITKGKSQELKFGTLSEHLPARTDQIVFYREEVTYQSKHISSSPNSDLISGSQSGDFNLVKTAIQNGATNYHQTMIMAVDNGYNEIALLLANTIKRKLNLSRSIPQFGPVASSIVPRGRSQVSLGQRVSGLIDHNLNNPDNPRYMDISNMRPDGTRIRIINSSRIPTKRIISNILPIVSNSESKLNETLKQLGMI